MRGDTRPRSRGRLGFTMPELLVAFVIISVLAFVAVNAFKRYKRRANSADGLTMLAHIKAKQQSYRSEFDRYAHVPAWHPATVTPNKKASFTPIPDGWKQLGLQASIKVTYFQISTSTELGGNPPQGLTLSPPWFVAEARAEFDNTSMHYLVTSEPGPIQKAEGSTLAATPLPVE